MNENISYQHALNNLVMLHRILATDGMDPESVTLCASAVITHISMCYDVSESTVHQNARLFNPHFPEEA